MWKYPGDGDGQGGLACCNSRGCKELDTTDPLNWTELKMGPFTSCSRNSKKVNVLKPSELRGNLERDDITAVARIQTWWALVSQAMNFVFFFPETRRVQLEGVQWSAFKKDYIVARWNQRHPRAMLGSDPGERWWHLGRVVTAEQFFQGEMQMLKSLRSQ